MQPYLWQVGLYVPITVAVLSEACCLAQHWRHAVESHSGHKCMRIFCVSVGFVSGDLATGRPSIQ